MSKDKSLEQIEKEMKALQKEAQAAKKREKKPAIKEVRQLIRKYRLTATDCGFSAKAAGEKKAAGVVRYRNPANTEQTWSGYGRAPAWLKDLEAQGKKRESFLV